MPNRNESRGNQGPKRSTPQGNPRPNKEERGGGEGTPVSANKSSGGGGGGGPTSGGHGHGGGGGGGGGRFRGQNQGQKRDHQNRNNADNEAQGSTSIDESGAKVEKKFTGRCRLFVGNLPGDINEANFKQMFEKFGEVSETFLNSQKGFGFIRLDTRLNAEAAKAALDGTTHKNRTIRVRFATHGAALRVKNIPNFVSNELLEQAFSMFGEVERAIVIVDDRGRPTKNGIVEFARKPGAQNALNRIRNGVFLLTISPYPITVEPLEQKDEEDGNPERYIQKSAAYYHEREKSPRFAQPGAFEFEWGQRWKALEEDEKLKREQLEKNIEETREKTMDEMELARHEHQAMLMRQELMRRQEELQRLEDQRREFELRRNEQQRQRDERRRQEEGLLRQQQEEALSLRRRQDEMRLQQDLMRRQEEMMHMDQGSMRSMQGAGGPQPLMGGGGTSGGPQGGNPDMMAQQMQGTQSRQSRFDQPPTGYNNGQNRGRGNQGGPIGAGGGGAGGGGQGGAGGPGGMGGGGPGGQQGGLGQAGRGPNQGGRGGPNQGGPGNNMGGGPGAAYGAGGPNRPPMDEMRRQPGGGERREIERVDRGRMDRREDYMTKRPRRF